MGRAIPLAVHLAAEQDLALGDVAGEVRDRVRHVVVGHGENGNLGDRTFALRG